MDFFPFFSFLLLLIPAKISTETYIARIGKLNVSQKKCSLLININRVKLITTLLAGGKDPRPAWSRQASIELTHRMHVQRCQHTSNLG
jgi:hypothetical protein